MAKVPFPLGLDGEEDLPRTKRTLKNCFNNGKGQIISRPGITKISTTLGVARGAFVWNGALYNVSGTSLIKITNVLTGAFSTIGTIAGSDNVEWAIGFNDAVIVVKGGALYTLSTSDVLTDISANANFQACVDVTHINGRFVYVPSNGDPAFFSDIGAAGTVQAASFFDAEELPDKNNGVFNWNNTLGIMGTDSIEFFRNTGGAAVFTRVNGSRISYGFIGGLQAYADSFVFIGRETDQGPGVYFLKAGAAEKISNPQIELILNNYTIEQLGEAIPGRLKWRGYDIFTLTLRADSLGFFGGNWFELDTVFSEVSRPWGGGFITQFEKVYYTAYESNFGKFDKVNEDYTNPITRIIDVGFDQPNANYFECSKVEVGISQGFNSAVGSVALFMTRDGVNYPIPVYRDLGALGKYADKLVWQPPGGLGNYEGYMGMRIYTTEDVVFSGDYFKVEIQ
jgi:hypothetical protein